MSVLRFDVKHPALIDHPVTGFTNLHPDAKGLLDFVCDTCQEHHYQRPLVTQFGRTRDDMEAIYFATYSKDHAPEIARDLARSRFSWHCVAKPLGMVRAFDLRDWIYSDLERAQILSAVKLKYGNAVECEDHAVPGGARHFHFAFKDPAGKPADWR